ncbi:MAG: MFS transporter [Thaumarchaeota archaeon]|nr:MFS transporter [Nitrososphaerota archaeon]MCL5317770.1 MFS transporter [Nitrososphaerota archaeon]
MSDAAYVFVGKAARVFVFGLVSVMTPVYLAGLGYSAFIVGVALATILAGNVFSNILLTWYGDYVGRKRSLLIFSLLMIVSGVLLYSTTYLPLMLLSFFLGNVSTTGTEAGPFQSIETGILPNLVSMERRNRAFGVYNLIGYSASSVGAFAASAPSYFQNSLLVFHLMYLLYGLVGLFLFILYLRLRSIEAVQTERKRRIGLGEISPEAKRDVAKLSFLFSIDAFGGGFVSQSLLSYWFFFVYHVSLQNLGIIFLVVNIISAISTLGASFIADKLGNLRTMVFTHLLSNIFLILIPLAGSLLASLLFLFLRQSVSQMDVPTRQVFMVEIFNDQERVSANAITNTFRSISSVFGSPISGALLAINLVSIPILAGGFSKILYDTLIFSTFRRRAK